MSGDTKAENMFREVVWWCVEAVNRIHPQALNAPRFLDYFSFAFMLHFIPQPDAPIPVPVIASTWRVHFVLLHTPPPAPICSHVQSRRCAQAYPATEAARKGSGQSTLGVHAYVTVAHPQAEHQRQKEAILRVRSTQPQV